MLINAQSCYTIYYKSLPEPEDNYGRLNVVSKITKTVSHNKIAVHIPYLHERHQRPKNKKPIEALLREKLFFVSRLCLVYK